MKPDIPEHIKRQYGSARNFKQAKRNVISRMRPIVRLLRSGCAYMPPEAQQFCHMYDEMVRACSQKEWGR